ncbi:hypothetical protein EJ110_NYTH39834 [Nymphaea thermarum]|nr:hypothetical protein EJ110_NYTH39834 [Nymphaea thermarum]
MWPENSTTTTRHFWRSARPWESKILSPSVNYCFKTNFRRRSNSLYILWIAMYQCCS